MTLEKPDGVQIRMPLDKLERRRSEVRNGAGFTAISEWTFDDQPTRHITFATRRPSPGPVGRAPATAWSAVGTRCCGPWPALFVLDVLFELPVPQRLVVMLLAAEPAWAGPFGGSRGR